MKIKHTSLPWNFDGHGINHKGERIAKVCHGQPYDYSTGNPVRNERFDADSHLIKSSPYMLQALEEIVAEIDRRNEEDCQIQGHYGYPDTYGIQLAREAIRLARNDEDTVSLEGLIRDAARATEVYSEDELEEYASKEK